MKFYYSPGSRRIEGQRFGWVARFRLRKRRKRSDDLENLKGWWTA